MNNRATEQSYALAADVPTGWQATFTPSGETTNVASLTVDAGQSQGVTVTVTPPDDVEKGDYSIPVTAISSEDNLSEDLSVSITGTYDVSLSTPDGRLSLDAYADKESTVTLSVTNNGNVDLTNLNLTSSAPTDWEVTFSESTIDTLEAGATKEITATIKPAQDVITGDYATSISIKNDEASSSADLRVSVKTSTTWGIAAIAIIVVLVAVLGMIFKEIRETVNMAEKMENIIQTSHLTKRYGSKIAVNDLNLSIHKGEVFGLLGPNGAGKTTTILMLLGLTEPTAGTAEIAGCDCTRNPLEVKSMVGYLPDNVGFYGDMTGRQNLRFTGRLNGMHGKELEERIDYLLDRVGMTDAADRKTATYSKGMRQRLGIADVLMKDPQVIIMDEPTLGIDPEGMRELLNLIRELSVKDGRTVLISSHQLQQIQQVCDRVGIYVQGSLIACGTLAELEAQIQKNGTYLLEVDVEPCDDQILGMLSAQQGILKIEKEGRRFMITSKKDIRPQLTKFLGEHDYTVMHLHQRGGDLDEIYRRYFEKAGQNDESNESKTKKKYSWKHKSGSN